MKENQESTDDKLFQTHHDEEHQQEKESNRLSEDVNVDGDGQQVDDKQNDMVNQEKTSLLGSTRNSMNQEPNVQYQNDFSTIAWDQEELNERKLRQTIYEQEGLKGKFLMAWYASQGWIAVLIVGIAAAICASIVDVSTEWFYDLKFGFCSDSIWLSKERCCVGLGHHSCKSWITWNQNFGVPSENPRVLYFLEYLWYTIWATLFAATASWLVYILAPAAAGSGMPEIKTILGGFSIRKVLGIWTFFVKSVTLILTVGSGLSLGKEGPLVHISCCLGNIFSRLFSKYNRSEVKKREILSASCAVGISVAFGAPVGGVLFSLEEASSYFPPKTLYRSFFCAIIGAIFFQLINPRNSGKLAVFPLSYHVNWKWFELVPFMFLGICGGLLGALFNKLNVKLQKFRRTSFIRHFPVLEVVILTIITSLVSYWNQLTRSSMTEQLSVTFGNDCTESTNLPFAATCKLTDYQGIVELFSAAVIRYILTVITFGAKLPAGLFIPSLSIGSLFGFLLGVIVKFLQETYSWSFIFSECSVGDSVSGCIIPGTYAIVGAAAVLTGVTRITVSCVVIMFEITGGLEYIVPLMLSITVSKWVADAIDKESIYELYIDMNGYPHLENKADIETTLGTAKDIMTKKKLIVVYADRNSLKDVKNLLKRNHIYGFPVVADEKSQQVVGYITRASLEAAHEQHKHYINLSTQFVFSKQMMSHGSKNTINKIDISDYLDESPIQITENTPTDRLYDLFRALGLRYCLVSRNGKLSGIITKKDVVRFLRSPKLQRSIMSKKNASDDKTTFEEREVDDNHDNKDDSNNDDHANDDYRERHDSFNEPTNATTYYGSINDKSTPSETTRLLNTK